MSDQSTFGKSIRSLNIPSEENIEKRLIFHDHGGQEAVLETFIPFIKDSDIILIFFKQIDIGTYRVAKDILNEMNLHLDINTKIFFVQTFTDHELNQIPEDEIKRYYMWSIPQRENWCKGCKNLIVETDISKRMDSFMKWKGDPVHETFYGKH